jgi:hypothetical protein
MDLMDIPASFAWRSLPDESGGWGAKSAKADLGYQAGNLFPARARPVFALNSNSKIEWFSLS